jgi:membrane-bound lytic murein transglycosylase B
VAARAAAAEDALTDRVRGLYMAGGPLSMYAALLESGSINDFQSSSALVGRVMADNQDLVTADQALVDEISRQSARADRAAEQSIATARDVAQVADRVERLLAEQQQLLDEAQAEVAHLEAVEAARAALAAQAAALGSITTSRLASLRVMPPASVFMELYRKAAPTCPGMSWTVLAAIGQVESGHGRNPSTSYAGAMGPMQFLPSTFSSYAVDGDDDGVADIMNPADAIFTAAHYLCANGAGRGPEALYRAIWHYNHADWYVQMVLRLSEQYAA